MKKIQVYASPAGGGKSATLLIDAVRTKKEKIAFISIEMDAFTILNRINSIAEFFKIENEDVNITVFSASASPQYDLIGKLEQMKNKYDIIIIDGYDAYPTIVEGENLHNSEFPFEHKIAFTNIVWDTLFADKYFFKKETRCHSLWISANTYRTLSNSGARTIKFPTTTTFANISLKNKIELKKYSHRKYDDLSKVTYTEVIDFDNRRIEQYNLSEIFKPV